MVKTAENTKQSNDNLEVTNGLEQSMEHADRQEQAKRDEVAVAGDTASYWAV